MAEFSHKVENMLDEMVAAMQQQLPGGINLESRVIHGPRGFVLDVEARCTLHAGQQVKLDDVSIRHAANAQEFVTEFVDEQLKPMQQRLERAASAAARAWKEQIDKREEET